jgi:PAS domain S-box-containing protein
VGKDKPSYEELERRCRQAEEMLAALRADRAATKIGGDGALEARLAEAEEREAHIKQVLAAIRSVNQLIVQETDAQRLIERSCATLTETRGYFNVWIAVLDAHHESVVMTAASGLDGPLDQLRQRLERGEFPTCMKMALAQNEIVIVVDPKTDCPNCPLACAYVGRAGYTRRLAFGGEVYGSLAASVPLGLAHDDEEQSLFEEVAADLAFALRKIKDARELRESEERYRLLFGTMTSAFALHEVIRDSDGKPSDYRFIQANPAFERLTGLKAGDLVGRTVREVLPDIEPHWIERYGHVVDTGETVHFENYNKSLDRHYDVTAYRPRHGQFAAIFTDVTDPRRAQEALRQSEEQYRLLADNTVDAIWLMGLDATFKYMNPAGAALLGYGPDEIAGVRLQDCCDEENLGIMVGAIQEALATLPDLTETTFEVVMRRHDGQPINLEITGRVVVDDEQRPVWLQGISRDITERKRADEEREKLRAQLLQAQKLESVGRLAGGVAHDFNNMLGVILGNLEMALERTEPGLPLHAELMEIQRAAERSADLTRQLLAFARKQTVAPTVLDVNEAVQGVLTMLRRLIGEDIDLAWMPAACLWPVKVDPAQIDQVLANLCVNARDAISGVGKVTIETGNVALDTAYCADHPDSLPGDYVMLAVNDDGCGMDDGTLANLFEPFFTTKPQGEGTGLGLAMVYGIVKQNEGFINVCSEPDRGTTFKIYLPRHAGGAEPAVARTAASKPPEGNGETVLLVEDDTAILSLSERILAKLGYAVLSANTPEKALDLAAAHAGKIHLLITDVIMPGMNGRELATRLHELHPDLKSLFMSGYTANVIAHRGVLDAGVQFIQKPFSRLELGTKIREALDRG